MNPSRPSRSELRGGAAFASLLDGYGDKFDACVIQLDRADNLQNEVSHVLRCRVERHVDNTQWVHTPHSWKDRVIFPDQHLVVPCLFEPNTQSFLDDTEVHDTPNLVKSFRLHGKIDAVVVPVQVSTL